jgi:hypothetical protein
MLAFGAPVPHNSRMSVGAVSAAVQGVNAGSAIAVSVLSSAESAEKQQITTLFSSLGIGGNVSATA